MSSSASKRPRDDNDGGLPYEGTSAAPKKARDWRDAFLDEGSERSHAEADHRRHRPHAESRYRRDEDRERVHYRDHDEGRKDHGRHSGSGGGRVSNDDHRRQSHDKAGRSNKYPGGHVRSGSRDDDRGLPYGDAAGPSRSARRPQGGPAAESYADHGQMSGMKGGAVDREEGEIVPSPKPPQAVLPADSLRSTSTEPAPSAPADIAKTATSPEPPTETSANLNATDEPEDLEAKLEERRRKRRELMEKLAGTQSGVTSTAASTTAGLQSVISDSKAQSQVTTPGIQAATAHLHLASAVGTPTGRLTPSTDEAFDLSKVTERSAEGAVNAADVLPATQATEDDGEQQISAADYNPNDDRKHDEERLHMLQQHTAPVSAVKVDPSQISAGVGQPGSEVVDVDAGGESEYEEVEVEDEDDDFDMFAMDEPRKKKTIRRKKQKFNTGEPSSFIAPIPIIPALQVSTLVDNYDDAEGYYRITPGELLDNARYQVTTNLGKGMFSAVIKAKVIKAVDADEKLGQEIAIKVIRSQESMYVAGRKEAQILFKLAAADPDDKKHIVRMIRTFEHRGHLCIVTESLSMNLRDVVKRFGKDVGLNLRAVRAYAHQMFLALSLMKKCNIIHADIKPDNILVTENKAVLKVCDLGSACDATVDGSEITPYLVSRFYRAPEIILGLPYDEALDMWAVGSTLFELYTGKILFPGRSNNHMLHLMMDLKGKFSHRMIKKSKFGEMHFDEGMNFRSVERDKITGQDVTKTIVITKPSRELKSRLLPPSSVQMKMKDEELKLIVDFVDLVDKCLVLDPSKRLTCREALMHPFLGGGN